MLLQARRAYRQAVRAAVAIQAAFRGFQSRKFSRDIKKHRAALLIQTNWRRHRAEVSFQRYRLGVVAAQCAWRCKLARRELRKRRTQSRESGKLLQDKQALEGKLREVQNILQTVQTQRNELRQQYKVRQHPNTCLGRQDQGLCLNRLYWLFELASPPLAASQEEKGQREAAESRVAELEQGTAARIAELEAAKAAALAAAVAARAAAEGTVAELRAELASVSESAASAQAALTQELGQLKSRAAGLEAQRADIQVRRGEGMAGCPGQCCFLQSHTELTPTWSAAPQAKAAAQVEDLMTRLNNAVSQRNAAREELLMAQAKLKQLQEDIDTGRVQVARGAPASPESGHLIPSVGGMQEEGVLDRMKRYMQGIPGASPIRDQNGGITPLNGTPSGRTAEGLASDAGLSEMDRRQRELYAKQQQLLREQRSADQDRLLTAISGERKFRAAWRCQAFYGAGGWLD